jgi:hypothetical protein
MTRKPSLKTHPGRQLHPPRHLPQRPPPRLRTSTHRPSARARQIHTLQRRSFHSPRVDSGGSHRSRLRTLPEFHRRCRGGLARRNFDSRIQRQHQSEHRLRGWARGRCLLVSSGHDLLGGVCAVGRPRRHFHTGQLHGWCLEFRRTLFRLRSAYEKTLETVWEPRVSYERGHLLSRRLQSEIPEGDECAIRLVSLI